MIDLLAAQGLHGDYPHTWDDFIGQEPVKRQLRVACQSARAREVPLAHTLIASGMPGIGKTSLALLTTAELGVDLRVVSGRMSANQARIVLAGMRDRDVLFIDEIHRLVEGGKRHAEWLLHLLQDGVLMGPTGPERQPRVTVIGATTDVGRLPEVIVGRFDLRPSLVPYTDEEAQVIAIRMAGRIFDEPLALPSIDNHAAIARGRIEQPQDDRLDPAQPRGSRDRGRGRVAGQGRRLRHHRGVGVAGAHPRRADRDRLPVSGGAAHRVRGAGR